MNLFVSIYWSSFCLLNINNKKHLNFVLIVIVSIFLDKFVPKYDANQKYCASTNLLTFFFSSNCYCLKKRNWWNEICTIADFSSTILPNSCSSWGNRKLKNVNVHNSYNFEYILIPGLYSLPHKYLTFIY